MINWIRSKLHNFIFPQDNEAKLSTVREREEADIEGMRFTVMPAEGGTIVQLRTYDRRKDETNMKTFAWIVIVVFFLLSSPRSRASAATSTRPNTE